MTRRSGGLLSPRLVRLAAALAGASALRAAGELPPVAAPRPIEAHVDASAAEDRAAHAGSGIPMFGDAPLVGNRPAEPARGDEPVRRPGNRGGMSRPAEQTAAAADTGWLRTLASLAAVTGLILLLAWGYRTVMQRAGSGRWLGRPRQADVLEVLARTAITPKLGVCLVRVGPRMVLLGVAPDRLTPLDVVHDPELTAVLAGAGKRAAAEQPHAAGAPGDFRQVLQKHSVEAAAADADAGPEQDVPDRLSEVRTQLGDALERLRSCARNT